MTTGLIFTAVTSVFPATREDIIGPRRRRNESDARHITVYLLRTHCRLSNSQIGHLLGNRCPSIGAESSRKFLALYATDKKYRAMADRVLAALGVTEVAA